MAKLKRIHSNRLVIVLPIVMVILFAAFLTYSFANFKSIKSFSIIDGGHFTGNKYTLTYDENSCSSKTIQNGKTYGTLCVPNIPGYTFNGWVGKNLYNKDATPYMANSWIAQDGTITSESHYDLYKIDVLPNTTYTITNGGKVSNPGYALFDASDNYLTGDWYHRRTEVTFTTPATASYMLFSVVTDLENFANYYDQDIFQIEVGSSATSYEPYHITSDTKVYTNDNICLFADKTINDYTVSFDANGGGINNQEYFRFNGRTQTINGTIFNATWGTDYLEFNRSNNSVVALDVMNPDTAILAAEFSVPSFANDEYYYVISNLNGGGFQIFVMNQEANSHQNEIAGSVNIEDTNQRVYSNFPIELNKKYKVVLSYDGVYLKLFVNGVLTQSRNIPGVINPPKNACPMSLGANPNVSTGRNGSNDGGLLTGKIYNATVQDNPRVTSKTVTYNDQYGTLPTPTKEYHTFVGWEDENGEIVTSSSINNIPHDSELTAKYTYNYVCQYKNSTYGNSADHYSVGTMYECDLGDGVARNFYVLKNNSTDVELIMEQNLSDTIGSSRTMNWSDATNFFESGHDGYATKEAWVHALDISIPSAQDIIDASLVVSPKNGWSFDVSTASADWFCLGSHVKDQPNSSTLCPTSATQQKVSWLFSYTMGCANNGCYQEYSDTDGGYSVGYWTTSENVNGTSIWVVDRYGRVDTYAKTNNNYLGVRPVVTLNKTSLYE